jgi:hypothetical protein
LNRRKRRRLEASAALESEERRISRLEAEGARDAEGRGDEGGRGQGGSGSSGAAPFKLDKATLRTKRAIEATRHVHAAAKKAKASVRERAVQSGAAVSTIERTLRRAKKEKPGSSKGKLKQRREDNADDAGDGRSAAESSKGPRQANSRSGGKFKAKSSSFKSKSRFKRR